MKLALPKNEDLINQHFGKSKSFEIVSIENNEIKDREEVNVESLQHNHGGLAGILIEKGVDVVITGGIGQGALDALSANNLKVIRGANGKIDDVVDSYIRGDLKDKNVVCNHDHGEHHKHVNIKMSSK